MTKAKVLLLLFIIFTSACSSTHVVHTWSNSAYKGPDFKNIMVMGIGRNDENVKIFEIEFSEHLNKTGAIATPAMEVLTEDERTNYSAIVQKVKAAGFDAVLVTKFVKVEEEYTPKAPHPSTSQVSPGRYDSFGTYHASSYEQTSGLPTSYKTSWVTLETVFYQVSDQVMVWSAVTKTINPSGDTIKNDIKELANLVIKDLSNTGLLDENN